MTGTVSKFEKVSAYNTQTPNRIIIEAGCSVDNVHIYEAAVGSVELAVTDATAGEDGTYSVTVSDAAQTLTFTGTAMTAGTHDAIRDAVSLSFSSNVSENAARFDASTGVLTIPPPTPRRRP